MNTLKKATVFVLALVLILSCSIAASAASITIGNAQPGQTYQVYKMFDVTATTPAEGEEPRFRSLHIPVPLFPAESNTDPAPIPRRSLFHLHRQPVLYRSHSAVPHKCSRQPPFPVSGSLPVHCSAEHRRPQTPPSRHRNPHHYPA